MRVRNPADIILELESDNSRLFKESIISKEIQSGNSDFLDGIRLCCDKLITFGIGEKTVPKVNWTDGTLNELSFSEFKENINKLINREITGNAAKQMISSMAAKSSTHDWNNWYRRILIKDLKCGVSEATINNCAKKCKSEYRIPVFSCQLANDSRNFEDRLVGRKMLSEKLDGTRVLSIVYPDGKVDQFSRNGKELLNFPKIKSQLSTISKSISFPVVLDGEVMSSSFQALMSQLYRKEDIQTDDSVLYLFDIIDLDSFKNGYSKMIQALRVDDLEKLIPELDNVKVLENKFVDLSTEQGRIEYKIFNKKCVESGKEGIMIKDPDAPYECKRTRSWLKLKPVMTLDLQIVDIQEGTDKYVGKLGALICRGIEDDKEISVNVGSGFTDEQRELYWDNKYDVIGKIAEIKCDAITKNQNGTYSLRFPVFMRLRGFKVGEKM